MPKTFEEGVRKTKNITTTMYDGDWELLLYIKEYLGCSQAEAMRSALRSFATQIATIQKTRG